MLKKSILGLCLLAMAAPAWGLSVDEVIRLKQSGVSDEVIQKMIDQDSGPRDGSGVWETSNQIIYQAAPRQRSQDEHYRHERWKEETSMNALGNIVIDGRRPLPEPRQ